MARPECTDLRARYSLLSGVHSPLWGRGHYKLESFGFFLGGGGGGKFWIKNGEILPVGKIAGVGKLGGGLVTCLFVVLWGGGGGGNFA